MVLNIVQNSNGKVANEREQEDVMARARSKNAELQKRFAVALREKEEYEKQLHLIGVKGKGKGKGGPILIDESPVKRRTLQPQQSVETIASTSYPMSSPSAKDAASTKSSPTTAGGLLQSPLTNNTVGGNPWEPVDNGPRKKLINSEISRRVQQSSPLFGQEIEYRIQLTNVPYFAFGFDDDAMRNFFACFGPISKVQADTSNQGVAYVTFTKRWAAMDLIKALSGRVILDHCIAPLQVTWAPNGKQESASQQEIDAGLVVGPEHDNDEKRPATYNFEPKSELWGFTMIQSPVEVMATKQKAAAAASKEQQSPAAQQKDPAGSPSGSSTFAKPIPPVPPSMAGIKSMNAVLPQPPPPAGKPPMQRSTTSQGVTFVNPYEITALPDDLKDRAPKEPGGLVQLRLPAHIAPEVAMQASRFSMRDGSGVQVLAPPLPMLEHLPWGQGSNHPTPNPGPSPLGVPGMPGPPQNTSIRGDWEQFFNDKGTFFIFTRNIIINLKLICS